MLSPAAVAALAFALTTPALAEEKILGSFTISWNEIQAKPTGASGMSRAVVRERTATLDELEMHITALPPGKTTHPPHTHPNEEVIIIREGTVESFQNGVVRRLGPGSIIFQASNVSHNLTNVGDTTAVYHVINWMSPGMKAKAARASSSPGQAVGARSSATAGPNSPEDEARATKR
jgi:quercetin dioxygenase-like cupin family protein